MYVWSCPVLKREEVVRGSTAHALHHTRTRYLAMATLAGVGLLDIVAAQPVAQGKEVHNTYGEHGNAELVSCSAYVLPAAVHYSRILSTPFYNCIYICICIPSTPTSCLHRSASIL